MGVEKKRREEKKNICWRYNLFQDELITNEINYFSVFILVKQKTN
jgi:hypothetical protein